MSLIWSLQALLIRHEAYMADAEQERLKMSADIDRLEGDKLKLEAENARKVEENKDLMSQLEELNSTVDDSDAHIKSLNATLLSTQEELRRLTALASRTEQLELQFASLEQEQSRLHQTLAETQEEERCAVHRWRRAERTLVELEDQIEKIEKESREERERHIEVVGRMERTRAVERELDGAAGRLKGAAAMTMGRQSNGTNVVSHFVKDILQDNANLQLGIVELREMLMNSNEEVQSLRELVLNHQPITTDHADRSQTPTLGMELATESLKENSPALHVHHHYHAPRKVETPAKEKVSINRRPKKRHTVTTPGIFSPPSSGSQTPRTPRSQSIEPQCASTSSAILSYTSVSIPSPTPRSFNRLSTQSRSSIAPSSVPSSPQSIYQMSSIFDRPYNDTPLGSSRPTSPESIAPASPPNQSRRRTCDLKYFQRDFSNPTALHPKAATPAPVLATFHPSTDDAQNVHKTNIHDLDLAPTGHATIPEEDESQISQEEPPASATESDLGGEGVTIPSTRPRPLHRASSHESLLSIAGMNTHALRQRPSQLLSTGRGFSPSTPYGISSPSTAVLSSKPVLSATTATARPPVPRRGYDSSSYRTLLANSTSTNTNTNEPQSASQNKSKETIGKRMGGWVWGKRGVSPTASSSLSSGGNLHAKAALTAASEGIGGSSKVMKTTGGKRRKSSALARGEVAGVKISEVDEDLLRESLGD